MTSKVIAKAAVDERVPGAFAIVRTATFRCAAVVGLDGEWHEIFHQKKRLSGVLDWVTLAA